MTTTASGKDRRPVKDRKKLPPSSLRRPEGQRYTIEKPRKSATLTLLTGLILIYSLLPLVWLFISSSKTQTDLLSSFGLWFGGEFALFDNISRTLQYDDGVFVRWFFNTVLYVVVGAGGATFLAMLGGYALAKFSFPGKKAVFAIIIGAAAVPGTALAIPTFLLFSQVGITNTPWSVIIPSLISPFGLYLMWVYATDGVPKDLLEAASLDGAGPFSTFFRISIPLLGPAIVTVLLFSMVATWNNYFLPLVMIKNPDWYPLTVGLANWNAQASTPGGAVIFDLVLTGSLLTIVPLIAAFLFLQRYWQSGIATGGVKE